jgi:hypothetical protein
MTGQNKLDEWLALANKRYKEAGICHAARPWRAAAEYSIEFRHSFVMGNAGPDNYIFTWFKQHTKPGSQEIGSLYKSGFLYDECFWALEIPICFGSSQIYFSACLGEMPEAVRGGLLEELGEDSTVSKELIEHWSNCIDYALGARDLIDGNTFKSHAIERLKSADQDMRAANQLLLFEGDNQACALSYRFAVEKLLKAVGWHESIFSSEKDEKKFGHRLKDLSSACASKTGKRFFDEMQDRACAFPSWGSRYEEVKTDSGSLWQAAFVAQGLAANITRLYSDRDSRAQICPWLTDHDLSRPTPQDP